MAEGVSGKILEFSHQVGDNGGVFMPFLKLLPDGNYKPLCGGLELIPGVCPILEHDPRTTLTHIQNVVRIKEIREKVAQHLPEIPDAVSESQFYGNLYKPVRSKERVQTMYVSLLIALEHVVRWYSQPRPGKSVRFSLTFRRFCLTVSRESVKGTVEGTNLKRDHR